MARDPNRIPEILDKIREVWEQHPDMRLGQLIVNVTRPKAAFSDKVDLFYVEDDVLLDELQEWVETSRDWKSR